MDIFVFGLGFGSVFIYLRRLFMTTEIPAPGIFNSCFRIKYNRNRKGKQNEKSEKEQMKTTE